MSPEEPVQIGAPGSGSTPPELGDRLRQGRLALGLSVRELARRLTVSPSLISQIERGKATPSVGTLYAMTNELGLSLDELFSESPDGAGARQGAAARPVAPVPDNPMDPVVRPDERKRIALASGVRWERLTRAPDAAVDFLYVVYEPGGASCEEGVLMRHEGREYGYVLSGLLAVTVGFEEHRLGPHDSISFDSTIPHRLATVGVEPAHAIWMVVGRLGDPRFAS